MIAEYGGHYLTMAGSDTLPEGGHWKPERVVIIEFPDMDFLDRWYNLPEYQPLIALRKACTSDLDMAFTQMRSGARLREALSCGPDMPDVEICCGQQMRGAEKTKKKG
jgi:hypothetical protein